MGAISLAGFHLGFRPLSSGELRIIDNHLRHSVHVVKHKELIPVVAEVRTTYPS